MSAKEKKSEIIVLNVVFCLLVIFIHISSQAVTSLSKQSWQFVSIFIPWRLSAFVVQGFILLSGMKFFLNYNPKRFKLSRFYLTRLKLIVIPYILWVIVYYIYFVYNDFFPFRIAELAQYIFLGNLVAHFYFVIIIVQFYVLMPLWIKLIKRVPPVFAISASLIIMILCQWLPDVLALFNPNVNFKYYDRIFITYVAYWVIGCYVGVHYTKFKEIISAKAKIVTLLFALFATVDVAFSYVSIAFGKSFAYLETLHVLYAFSVIMFLYSVSIRFSDSIVKNKLILGINKSSYTIYLSHCLVMLFANNILANNNVSDILYSLIFRFIFTYTITLFICIAYDKLKTKIKLNPYNTKGKTAIKISR